MCVSHLSKLLLLLLFYYLAVYEKKFFVFVLQCDVSSLSIIKKNSHIHTRAHTFIIALLSRLINKIYEKIEQTLTSNNKFQPKRKQKQEKKFSSNLAYKIFREAKEKKLVMVI